MYTRGASYGRSSLKSRPGWLNHVEVRAVSWPQHTLYLPAIINRRLVLMSMRWSVVFLDHTFIAVDAPSPLAFLCKRQKDTLENNTAITPPIYTSFTITTYLF